MIALILMVTTACNKKGTDSMNTADKTFLERASSAYNAEVELGNLAASKGMESSVKSYGQLMATDYNAAKSELTTLAQARDYKLNSNPDAEHIALKVVLNNKFNREFDSVYMKNQVIDHIQSVGIFQDEINDGKDQGLKDYAAKMLPKIQAHKNAADVIVTANGY